MGANRNIDKSKIVECGFCNKEKRDIPSLMISTKFNKKRICVVCFNRESNITTKDCESINRNNHILLNWI